MTSKPSLAKNLIILLLFNYNVKMKHLSVNSCARNWETNRHRYGSKKQTQSERDLFLTVIFFDILKGGFVVF